MVYPQEPRQADPACLQHPRSPLSTGRVRGKDQQKLSKGGPGATQAVLTWLKFLREYFGFPFHIDGDLLPIVPVAATVKPEKRADPLTIRDVMVLEFLCQSNNEVTRNGSDCSPLLWGQVQALPAQLLREDD